MTPIHELLARIRWDPEFGKGLLEIAYYDRVGDTLVRVDLERVHTDPAAPAVFEVVDQSGAVHRVPLHRIKQVFRDGVLIWHREH